MPIDARIPLGVQPIQIESPLTAITQIAQLQGLREQTEARRLAAEEARQKAQDERAIRQVLTETGGDWDAALPRLRTIAPGAAMKFETELANQRKAGFEALKADTEQKGKRLDLGLKVWQSVTDDGSLQAARPMILALSPELKDLLPTTYDPAAVQRISDMALSAKDLLDRKNEALKLFTEGKTDEAVGKWLSTAGTPEAWTATLKNARDLGVPAPILAQFGDWSPDAPRRAAQLAITPEKRETLAAAAARDAQAAAHQAVTEAQGAAQLDISRGNLGVARGNLEVARQRLAQGGGDETDRGALIDAVINSPGLWDQITPTERGKIAGELQRRGFDGFGKPLSDAAIGKISDTRSAIASLGDLREVVKTNEQYIGPLAGYQAMNPYSEGRKAKADMDRVRQRVGKAMEGGVLRKEDEEKYKGILATLYDDPTLAVYKIDQLEQDLKRDIEIFQHEQRLAGRRVPSSPTTPPPGPPVKKENPFPVK